MSILYDDQKHTFTLHTEHSTYQMQADPYGFLLHLYYGRKTDGCMDYLLTYADRGFSGNPYDAGQNRMYSLDVLPQEFPCRGTGDYRSLALDLKNADGSYGCDLRYQSYEICDGKYHLPGLPAVYANDSEAQTLKVYLADPVSSLKVTLLYGVLPKYDIITRSVEVINESTGKILLENVKSACLDFLDNRYDIISFYGRHAMERNFQRIPVSHGNFVIGSRRGTSSHQYNPLMILADHTATEDAGDCYAMSFVYSGSFRGEVEQDQYEQTRAILGLACELFSYPLNPGEHFYAPEVVMTYSADGLGQLSRNLHSCYRKHLCRGKFANQIRPVLINSWEASYFHFTGESIYRLAKQAAELGIEMLVLDDGWFGARNNDNSGLGDWYVNEEKIGCSLNELAKKINALGLKFGIWIEPEMVNEDSDLYRAHPDWAIQIPGRKPVRARNQLLLDFSRKEVVDAIFDQICNILDHANIEYVKWDMNRSMADVYSVSAADQGCVQYDYVLGLYDFLERLITRYPNLLIEGCSGGGGRFDAGMLYYTPQIWCSDNSDAIDRIRIQYGTSFGYPVSAVGSHVSSSPNHQNGRRTPLHTRAVVAMAGTFGYELNPESLSDEEKDEVRAQIADYHRYAPLIQNGQYYRLSNPFEDAVAAWEFVSEDGREILINAVTLEVHGNMNVLYVYPRGLKEGTMYEDQSNGAVYPADALMHAGLPVQIRFGEYLAYQWHLKTIGDEWNERKKNAK